MNLELRTCCPYRNSNLCGVRGADDDFVTLVVKMVYARCLRSAGWY